MEFKPNNPRASTYASKAPAVLLSVSIPERTPRSALCRQAEADYLINVDLRDTATLLEWWYGEENLRRSASQA